MSQQPRSLARRILDGLSIALQLLWSIPMAILGLVLQAVFRRWIPGPSMDEAEAKHLLSGLDAEYRQESYGYWEGRIDAEPIVLFPMGDSGCEYQVEIRPVWDDRRGGNIRVLFSIDDGRGWRAYCPMTNDFIIARDGSFVGE